MDVQFFFPSSFDVSRLLWRELKYSSVSVERVNIVSTETVHSKKIFD